MRKDGWLNLSVVPIHRSAKHRGIRSLQRALWLDIVLVKRLWTHYMNSAKKAHAFCQIADATQLSLERSSDWPGAAAQKR